MAETCSKCQRRKIIDFDVEPEAAFALVVLNRWRVICASCFDVEAERAGVKYTFRNLLAESWAERPAPRNPYRRKR